MCNVNTNTKKSRIMMLVADRIEFEAESVKQTKREIL